MRQTEVYVLRWRPKGDHHLVFEKCRQRWYRPVSADRARLVLKGPLMVGGVGSVSSKRPPPCTMVSVQTSFFIAFSGFTQGPPVWLQPGAAPMVTLIPSLSAS